jgi:GT2 family glycosyltransferase
MNKPLVSVIIVNFNGLSVLKPCLESLLKSDYPNYEIIVVDNGSADQSVKYLEKVSFKNVKVITSETNVGFAGGNNLGLSEVEGKYLLLLNNDTLVPKNLLSVLVDKMESDKTVGALQPKIKFMDQPEILDNAGAYLNVLGLTTHWGFGEKDRAEFDQEKEIFSAKGACLMTRMDIVNKVGLFDDNFGSYFEESDFCWRVWLSGYRVIYFPAVSILHKVGFTSEKMDTVVVMLHSTKNRIFSLYKNLSLINLFRIFIPHLFFLNMLGLYYFVKLQFNKSWMIYGAIWWNFSHIGLLVQERRKTQRLRVKSDRELFAIIMKPLDIPALFSHFKKVEANLDRT